MQNPFGAIDALRDIRRGGIQAAHHKARCVLDSSALEHTDGDVQPSIPKATLNVPLRSPRSPSPDSAPATLDESDQTIRIFGGSLIAASGVILQDEDRQFPPRPTSSQTNRLAEAHGEFWRARGGLVPSRLCLRCFSGPSPSSEIPKVNRHRGSPGQR